MGRAGIKSFNRCNVKKVEFKDHVYASGSSGRVVMSDNPTEDGRVYAGTTATLHCPRTEDDLVSVESTATVRSHLKALKNVRQIAGELLCRDCIFSSMPPVEVAQHRTVLAKAETERVQAFGELAAARKEAIAEIEGTDADFQLPQ
jgi:hypothetical protein